jgi:hypothetical protein
MKTRDMDFGPGVIVSMTVVVLIGVALLAVLALFILPDNAWAGQGRISVDKWEAQHIPDGVEIYKIRVEGGWLYVTTARWVRISVASTFVPDPNMQLPRGPAEDPTGSRGSSQDTNNR